VPKISIVTFPSGFFFLSCKLLQKIATDDILVRSLFHTTSEGIMAASELLGGSQPFSPCDLQGGSGFSADGMEMVPPLKHSKKEEL